MMMRYVHAISLGFAMGVACLAATHDHGDGEEVKVISVRDIIEKLDGKDSAVSFVEVTIGPGKAGLPHRHPGPGFVYVIEGEYELGIDDQPTKRFKAGDSFYEPGGHLHRVSRNPAKSGNTRLIAVIVHPRDAKEVAIPEPAAAANNR